MPGHGQKAIVPEKFTHALFLKAPGLAHLSAHGALGPLDAFYNRRVHVFMRGHECNLLAVAHTDTDQRLLVDTARGPFESLR